MNEPDDQTDAPPPDTVRSIAVGGLVAALACVIGRGVVAADAFPWWSDDPTVIAVPTTGLLPVGSLLLSVLTIVASAVATWAAHTLTRRGAAASAAVENGLLLAGVLGATAHALWLGGGSLDDLQTGLAWAAAMSAGVAAAACRHDPGLRRLVLACLLGGLVMVAAKAGLQVFVEHPATVASFEANKDAVLASHGWSPGSPMARSFEHRLRQADATGWFGLSNVVATFGAAGAVMGLGLLIGRPRDDDEAPGGLAGAAVAFAAGAAMLVLGGSKGGYAGAAVGVICIVAAWAAARRPALGRWVKLISLAVVVAVLAAVAARLIVGERLGERSLLFRGYYLEAGWRIFASHLPWGTGPSGFRDAYMLAKNPLNPEEITSTHNVLADFACTLGLAGLAWGGLWLLWVARLGPALRLDAAPPAEPARVKDELKPVFLVMCAATILGVWLESAASTPEAAGMRVAGLVLSLLAAAGVIARADRPWARAGVAAGAVCLAALGLIDMAAVSPSSAGWYAMLLAGAGGALGLPARTKTAAPWKPIAAAAALVGVFAGLSRMPAVAAWQSSLRDAFDAVAKVSRLRGDLDDLMRNRLRQGTPEAEAAIERLTSAGFTPGMSNDDVGRRIDRLSLAAWTEALPSLIEASTQQPTHPETREAACRLQMRIATGFKDAGQDESAREAASGVLALSVPLAIGRPLGPGTLAWQASAIEGAYRVRGDTARLWAPECEKLLKAASELDPYSLTHPMRLAALYEEFGPPEEAGRWAGRVLELDEYNRMDPSGTRRLSDEQKAKYRSLVEAGKRSAGPGEAGEKAGGGSGGAGGGAGGGGGRGG